MFGKQRKNQQRSRRGNFEQLEQRSMMAGNVTVTPEAIIGSTSSNILFQGDSANNRIQILNDVSPYIYRIVGLPDSKTGLPTTVNGLPEVTFDFSSRQERFSLFAYMGEGDDEVYIRGSNFLGGDIHGDAGNDTLQIGDYYAISDPNAMLPQSQSSFTAHFTLSGDAGKDTFKVYNANFNQGDLLIEAGTVNSTSSQFETAPEFVELYLVKTLQLAINMGGGSDQVNIGYTTVSAATSIVMGRGNDLLSSFASRFGTIEVAGGSGDDFLALDVNSYDYTTNIYGDGSDSPYGSPAVSYGNDTILFSRSVFNQTSPGQKVWLNGEAGNDKMLIGKYYAVVNGQVTLANGGSYIPYLIVNLGDGNDEATFATNVIDELYFFMGGGDDYGFFNTNRFTTYIFYGDHEWHYDWQLTSKPGTDRLRRWGNSFDPSNANQYGIEANAFNAF